MDELWIKLLFLGIFLSLVPMLISIDLILLTSRRGFPKADALLGGILTMRVIQIVLLWYLYDRVELKQPATTTSTGSPNPLVSTIMIIGGLLAIAGAFALAFRHETAGVDLSKYLDRINQFTPVSAFLVAMALIFSGGRFWVFTLGAVSIVRSVEWSLIWTLIAFVYFAILSVVLFLIPLGFVFMRPEDMDRITTTFLNWLQKHQQTIGAIVSGAFGLVLLWMGLLEY